MPDDENANGTETGSALGPMTSRARVRRKAFLSAAAAISLSMTGCEARVETAQDVVDASIEAYGGDAFDRIAIQWTFRGVPFEVTRDDGVFRYQRTVVDSDGQARVEVMDNERTWIELEGVPREVDDATRRRIETAVNSVVYLGFLPFRLDDQAVRLTDLGVTRIAGESYRKVGVTFSEDGGGRDWQDRFVYWFHEDDWSLDYLAYWEAVDPPVTRFRRAVNRRSVGPIVVQDYENYAPDGAQVDITEFDRLFEDGGMRLVSMVVFDSVEATAVR